MNTNKVLNLIGLAKRANKVNSGEFICKKAIKSHMAKLVIIALDASDNTKKSIKNSCAFYKVEYIECASMEDLGKFTGGGQKAVISINDINFANAIKQANKNSH